jgi:hypothetical protein
VCKFLISEHQQNHSKKSLTNVTEVTTAQEIFEWYGSTVFDISRVPVAKRFLFANQLCQTLMDAHVNGHMRWECVIFEEAHTYLPNGCMRSLQKYGPTVDFVTQGRNYNLTFGLLTQFASQVDKLPVKLCEQRYFGWTYERNDKDYIKAILGKERAEECASLETGEFLYQKRDKIQRISTSKFDGTRESLKILPTTALNLEIPEMKVERIQQPGMIWCSVSLTTLQG